MAWPSPQDYNEAIQNPHLNFADSELKSGQPELTPLGLPKPISGSFAAVYHMQCGLRSVAVRCFTSEVSDQQKRYAAISQHLAAKRLPYTIGFSYVVQGIRVQGQWYPVLKMEWVPGEQLDVYIKRHLNKPLTLLHLADRWMRMIQALQAASIAHGDLQHGNVLVVNNDLKLIDYDGMFVPTLAGLSSHEIGHRNYQSPQRCAQDFGPYLDNFSAWTIYVSLLALSIDANLWTQAQGGDENLLFRREDFEHPHASSTLALFRHHPNVRLQTLASLFQPMLYLSPQQVPTLSAPPEVGHDQQSQDSTVSHQPSTQPTGVSASWIHDHLDLTSPPSPSPIPRAPTASATPTAAVPASPTWVLDLISSPQTKKSFELPRPQPRLIAYSAFVLLVLLLIAPVVLASVLLPYTFFLAIVVMVGAYTMLMRFYQQEPSVQTLRQLLAIGREEQNVALSLESKVKESEAEKVTLRSEATKALSIIAKERNFLKQQEAKDLARLQAELKTRSDALDARLQNLDKPLQHLRTTTSADIQRWNQEIAQANQSQANEITRALTTLQKQHVDNYLRHQTIHGAAIPGIGQQLKANLRVAGFATAADINYSVTQVHGIGQMKAAYLMGWRQQVEKMAQASKPSSLNPAQLATIIQKYDTQRQNLQQKINAATQHLQQEETATRARNSSVLQAIEAERRLAQEQTQKQIHNITGEYVKKLHQVAEKEQRCSVDTTQKLKAIDDKVALVRKAVYEQNWKTAKAHRDLEAYMHLTFWAYLRLVCLNRQQT